MTEPYSLPESEDLGLVPPNEGLDSGPIKDDVNIGPPPVVEDSPFATVERLTPEEQLNFETLITFGKKTATNTVFGHSVYLSTLNVEEELQVGLLVKPYLNTDAYTRAYKTAVVAASMKEIDGQPVYTPLSGKEDSNYVMRKKWDKIKEYYPIIVDSMYNCVTQLEQDLAPLIEKISKKTSG